MTEPEDRLTDLAPDISPTTLGERVADLGQFGLALAGGFPGIAGYLFNRIQKRRDGEVRDYLHAVGRRLQAVEDKIARDDPDMESAIEEILEKAWSRKQREKRDYWAAAAAHTATNDAPDAVERKRMIDALEGLRLSHLRLLHLVSLDEPPEGWAGGNMDAYVSFGIPGIDIALMRLDWSDLQTAGILGNYPSGMTVTPQWQIAHGGITGYGQRFIAFVEA
jgi:hypothetical protein